LLFRNDLFNAILKVFGHKVHNTNNSGEIIYHFEIQ
jgi:hypothetical protein